jgi:hypothetical protein
LSMSSGVVIVETAVVAPATTPSRVKIACMVCLSLIHLASKSPAPHSLNLFLHVSVSKFHPKETFRIFYFIICSHLPLTEIPF